MTTIVALAGSLRGDSFNRRLLRAISGRVPAGVRMDVWEGLRAVPAFDEDLERGPTPLAVADLREQIRAADVVLIATPEYNGSVPGALKNALDWVSRPYATNALRGKPVAVIGASPSPGGARQAQEDLRRILAVIGAEVLDVELAVATVHRRFDPAGVVADDHLQRQLEQVLRRLLDHVNWQTVRLAG